MKININGQEFSDEDFARYQQQSVQSLENARQQLIDKYKCGYAIINVQPDNFGRIGYSVVCGLTKENISSNTVYCNDCQAKKEINFSIKNLE